MDNRLYKQQMDRMRPIEQRDDGWWRETKLVGAALLALILSFSQELCMG